MILAVMGGMRRKPLSPKEKRDLDIEIDFLARLTRRAPTYVEALQVLGEDYTRRGRYAEGLEVDRRLAELCPDDPTVFYNLACSYALTDQPEEAYKALRAAVEKGYRDFRWMEEDPDLEKFRRHPLYRKLRAELPRQSRRAR